MQEHWRKGLEKAIESTRGVDKTEEHKQKIREKKIGRDLTESHRKAISEAMKRKKRGY